MILAEVMGVFPSCHTESAPHLSPSVLRGHRGQAPLLTHPRHFSSNPQGNKPIDSLPHTRHFTRRKTPKPHLPYGNKELGMEGKWG